MDRLGRASSFFAAKSGLLLVKLPLVDPEPTGARLHLSQPRRLHVRLPCGQPARAPEGQPHGRLHPGRLFFSLPSRGLQPVQPRAQVRGRVDPRSTWFVVCWSGLSPGAQERERRPKNERCGEQVSARGASNECVGDAIRQGGAGKCARRRRGEKPRSPEGTSDGQRVRPLGWSRDVTMPSAFVRWVNTPP